MESGPTILAASSVPIGEAQIVEWTWPSPLDITVCEQRHMIETSVPPLAAEGIAFLTDVSASHRTRIGRLFVRPAGVKIRSRSIGGRIRVVRLAVDPRGFETLTGQVMPVGEGSLRAGLDLRDRTVGWLMTRMRAELEAPGFAHETLLDAYTMSLAVETARALNRIDDTQREAGQLAPWQEKRVRDRLAAEGTRPSVAELAGLCGISTRHFARLCGGRAAGLINDMQVSRAMDMLGNTRLSMKVISGRLGFNRPGSFSSAFRRAVGCTPSQYRQHTTGR